jgi:hypothetical protein
MNNDDIAEKLQGVDLEPLTAVIRDEVKTLLANDPTYFGGTITMESTNKIVANLKAIIDLMEEAA